MVDDFSQEIKANPTALPRILDANLDRAREGLRIIEEWCRFGLNQVNLADECKQLRQAIAKWHSDEIRRARDTPGDLGTTLTHAQEETRSNIQSLLQANLCRVQEALRVLEEYGKLYHPGMGADFKQMRYRVYALESQLLNAQKSQKLKDALLYLVTSPSENLIAIVEAALQGGLTLVQYRDKMTDDEIRYNKANQLCQLCHDYGALFLVNDRVDLALAVNADGVHLGQSDLPIKVARQLLGSQGIIGRSTTNPQEMQAAIAQGADYIGVGPVYATPTKIKAAAGLEYVRYAAQEATLPWFAIGGIDSDNLADILQAGAKQVALVRAIMQSDDPTQSVKILLQQLST
jgi:thiamine-phosphate pyrophosphorylase